MANFEWFTKVHRFLYHHTRGVIGGNLGAPMVLMYTIGAKTGQSRPVPLQYYPAGDEGVLVLASNNGQAKAPGWYFNLKAHPDIDIRYNRVHLVLSTHAIKGLSNNDFILAAKIDGIKL